MEEFLRDEFKKIGTNFAKVDKRFDTIDKTLASLGDHLVTIEDRLEKLADIHRLTEQVDRMRAVIREKLNVEV